VHGLKPGAVYKYRLVALTVHGAARGRPHRARTVGHHRARMLLGAR
jgi:hypothetical protein